MAVQRMSFITVAPQFGAAPRVSDEAVSSEISLHLLCVCFPLCPAIPVVAYG